MNRLTLTPIKTIPLMDHQTLFADILLPLPLPGYFTYRVPAALNELMQTGVRVVVPFGPRKIYSGLVRKVHQTPPAQFQAKYIHTVLDHTPVVTPGQFGFWEWMAEYYMCTPGEVMNAALPPAMKLASETRITLNPDFDGETEHLNEKEYLIVEALEIQKTLSLSEVTKISGQLKVFSLISNLMDKKIVLLQEELDNPYRPRLEKFVKLSPEYESEEKLKEAFDYAEKKAPRQLDALIAFIKLSGRYHSTVRDVAVKEITAVVKNAQNAIDALAAKGVFTITKQTISRFDHVEQDAGEIVFNEYQEIALNEIRELWKEKDCVLLHGVTSSGKTEMYIQLIKETLEKGLQALFLLPEIALTTQITRRIQNHFGDQAGVYHSRFNEMERTEVWNNLAMGGLKMAHKKINYQLVVGPRSALFLPFKQLGLIIVDEEHETSYKQHDPAPRYHARDAAIWLARQHGAKILLGSATPAVESFFNARSGKYGLVTLSKRYGGMQMPEIWVADVKKETREKTMKSHLSSLLHNQIQESLREKKQVILFKNRRGFAPHMECDQCNYIPTCTQCDVSLVYHKKINKLKCHYCGYSITPHNQCPTCGSTGIALKGFGTEKIEEELPLIFPDTTIQRMDLDTTRAKNAHNNIISDFEEKRIDILVGTQMVSKGLDFENVAVVGILSADSMLSFPDFRAHERAFQMMAQVSGRAGRKNNRGKVIIQALDPWHAVIRQVIDNNYEEMYNNQILERRNFHYPPFNRLVLLSLMHTDPQKVNNASAFVAGQLKRVLPHDNILGPEFPLVSRIKAQFIKNIMVKLDRKAGFMQQKNALKQIVDQYMADPKWKSVRLKINVDPG
jgi:primosomal protein N' (replication factor Y) (superfamily II helicase)